MIAPSFESHQCLAGMWRRLSCHAGHQEVGRCRTRGESQGTCNITRTPPLSSNKAEPTLALKPRGDVTRSPKQGYQWPHKKGLMSSKNLQKKKKDDLNSGTVVTLSQSPISVELEAVKGLLALKSEGKNMNQQLENPASETLTENPPAQTATNDQKASSPQSPAGVSENKTEVTAMQTIQTENTEWLKANEPPQVVETTPVETPTLTEPADQDDSPPGGVVISPLPSCPMTPVNLYLTNKIIEADEIKPTSPSTVQNNETDHVETKSSLEKNPVQIKLLLKWCSVKLTKLTDKDLQQLCGHPFVSGVDPKLDVETQVMWKPLTGQD